MFIFNGYVRKAGLSAFVPQTNHWDCARICAPKKSLRPRLHLVAAQWVFPYLFPFALAFAFAILPPHTYNSKIQLLFGFFGLESLASCFVPTPPPPPPFNALTGNRGPSTGLPAAGAAR